MANPGLDPLGADTLLDPQRGCAVAKRMAGIASNFALANAGVALSADVVSGHTTLIAAIVLGLLVGKPLGILLFAYGAVRLGLADKHAEYDWRQVFGAATLGGIGFTMSLFIAGQAFPQADDFAAAKIAVFIASILAGAAGAAILWPRRKGVGEPVGEVAACSPA